MNDRSSIPPIWLGFEDSGAITPSAPNTYRGSLERPRTYSVPECRPNQKRSSVSDRLSYSGGSTRGRPRKRESRWTHRRERDRDAGPIKSTDSLTLCYGASKAVGIAAGQWTPEESIVGGSFQLGSGSQASRPVSYPTVSKNRFASYGVLLFNMV